MEQARHPALHEDRAEQSLEDLTRTLEREPRHFGALSGLGQICLHAGEMTSALLAFERVLTIDPVWRMFSRLWQGCARKLGTRSTKRRGAQNRQSDDRRVTKRARRLAARLSFALKHVTAQEAPEE